VINRWQKLHPLNLSVTVRVSPPGAVNSLCWQSSAQPLVWKWRYYTLNGTGFVNHASIKSMRTVGLLWIGKAGFFCQWNSFTGNFINFSYVIDQFAVSTWSLCVYYTQEPCDLFLVVGEEDSGLCFYNSYLHASNALTVSHPTSFKKVTQKKGLSDLLRCTCTISMGHWHGEMGILVVGGLFTEAVAIWKFEMPSLYRHEQRSLIR
jgi:hypothetical protein